MLIPLKENIIYKEQNVKTYYNFIIYECIYVCVRALVQLPL